MIGNIPSLTPVGIPKLVDPRTWRQAIEKRLNEVLDQSLALITALDVMEANCDMEHADDGEPWLGWPDRGPSQLVRDVPRDDREADDSDWEDGGDKEPSLGATDAMNQEYAWTRPRGLGRRRSAARR